jgi:hypothetical protein
MITFWLVVMISINGGNTWSLMKNEKQLNEDTCKLAAVENIVSAARHPPVVDKDGNEQEYEIAVSCNIHHSATSPL